MSQLLQDMEPGFRAMAQRAVNAENDFVAALQKIANLSEGDAQMVFNAYVKLGLAKRDIVIGRYTVTHGAFLDRKNILRALSNLKA